MAAKSTASSPGMKPLFSIIGAIISLYGIFQENGEANPQGLRMLDMLGGMPFGQADDCGRLLYMVIRHRNQILTNVG